MEMRNDLYFDFTRDEKDYAIRYLLDAVIRSRANAGFPSNLHSYDEDVNIYLAHLLFAVSTTTYQKLAKKYVAPYPSDLVNLIENADDNYVRYFIYKINADNLLISLSVFQEAMKHMISERRIAVTNEAEFADRAKHYYDQAALYNQRIYRKKTAVGDVLDKLSSHFDTYCSILQVTRKDFFDFRDHFQDRRFTEFVQGVNEYEKEAFLKKKHDEFLDLYLEWLNNRNCPDLTKRVNVVCEQIKQFDPEFHFRIS